MRSRGVTLLELLVVLAIIVTITAGVTRAYQVSLGFEQGITERRDEWAREKLVEDRLRTLISSATLSSDNANPNSYFIGAGGLGENAQGGSEATDLVFVTAGPPIPTRILSESSDFETDNERFGPQGGLLETQIGTSPVGEAGGRSGLFLREQRPADGDPSQGGRERLLTEEVESMRFEFFDGLAWLALWDTREQDTKRLPSAVRVVYRLTGETADRILTVRLPNSDVTRDNPLSTGGQVAP